MQLIDFLFSAMAPKMGFSFRILSPFPKVVAKHSRRLASLKHSGTIAGLGAFCA